jgi:S-adenosylmethionine decarboxylase
MHLIIDGFGASQEALSSMEHIYKVLDRIPEDIGMTKLSAPCVFRYKESPHKDWGLSGFVVIAESHICVHTYPLRGYINVDIFSCKEFDAEQVKAFIKDAFSLKKTQVHLIRRGVQYMEE